MKFVALLLVVLASYTSANLIQRASLDFSSMSPSLCEASDQGSDWYCPYQCALQGFSVSSYHTLSGSFDMSGSEYVLSGGVLLGLLTCCWVCT